MDLWQAVWDARIDAHWRVRFYGAMGDRYHLWAKALELGAALSGATGALGWFATASPAIAGAFTMVGAVAAGLQSVLKLEKKYAAAQMACRHWQRRVHAWDAAWLEINASASAISLERYRLECAFDVDYEAPEVGDDPELRLKAHREAVHALGLATPSAA